ncbi:MAG: ABC transporter permease, partial [Oscillospiraceae bacterium]|nr:ABC transporter permease [Oscillospiraceae bacterium]
AFALLVSSFSPAPNIINIITQIVSLGMCFLCGVFVDQSMLGDGVLSAARFLPAYWYIRVNRMLEGAEVYDGQFAAKAIAIEAAFVVVLALLTVMLRKSHVRTPKPQHKPA